MAARLIPAPRLFPITMMSKLSPWSNCAKLLTCIAQLTICISYPDFFLEHQFDFYRVRLFFGDFG